MWLKLPIDAHLFLAPPITQPVDAGREWGLGYFVGGLLEIEGTLVNEGVMADFRMKSSDPRCIS